MSRLAALDLNKRFDSKEAYKEKMKQYQLQLIHMQRSLIQSKRSLILVFEGPDAAGKGGVIKRTVQRLDPRNIRVYSIIKPTPEEYRHPYMWRFWNKVPSQGDIAIFDRSWYGRVLVERVEGFAKPEDWRRAYDEINQFESLLVHEGAILLKFFLYIDRDEQLARFKARESDPYKHWKINDEDWRNRDKWDQHNEAAEEMFEKTDTKLAAWNLVEGNFKWYARVKVTKHIVQRLKEEGISE
ncbi:MAG: polyphosphate kinase 2 family protein [Candidatus Methylacidiphilales bacterium]